MLATHGRRWSMPSDIRIDSKEREDDQLYYSYVLRDMEQKISEYRSKKINNMDILSKFQALYDLIDTKQIVKLSFDLIAHEPQKLQVLTEIKDSFLFREKFVPENFLQGYIFVVEYLKIARLEDVEMDLFLFRRFYEGFIQKTTGLIAYDKICKIIDYADQEYPQTKEMKDLFASLNHIAKEAIREALRIMSGGTPVSLQIFSGEKTEDNSDRTSVSRSSNYSIKHRSTDPPVSERDDGTNYEESASEDLKYADSTTNSYTSLISILSTVDI
jgi:hypothetical protein